MGLNVDELKDKVKNTVDDVKENENVKKVVNSTKEVVDKVGEKSKDLLDDSKKTFRQVSEKIDDQIDKLRK